MEMGAKYPTGLAEIGEDMSFSSEEKYTSKGR